jgi:hypothetical protein
VRRVVTLKLHVDGVVVGISLGLVDDGIGLGEFPGGGKIENSILRRGGDLSNDIGEETI